MSKKEKVFGVFAKIALILNTIFMVVSIFNFATSFASVVPYIGTFVSMVKAPILSVTSSLFTPGLVFTILGFFGDKEVARKALKRLIIGVVFAVIAIIIAIILAVAASFIIALLTSLFYYITESSTTTYMMFM